MLSVPLSEPPGVAGTDEDRGGGTQKCNFAREEWAIRSQGQTSTSVGGWVTTGSTVTCQHDVVGTGDVVVVVVGSSLARAMLT